MCDLEEMLKSIKHEDPKVNLEETIPNILNMVENFIKTQGNIKSNLKDLLIPSEYNLSWIYAHGKSIIEYIKYLLDNKTTIEKNKLDSIIYYTIYDFMDFNSLLLDYKKKSFFDHKKENVLSYISSPNNFFFTKPFTAAKNLCTGQKDDFFIGEYKKELSSFYIRQAIELQIKYKMLGIKSISNKKKEKIVPKFIAITQYVDFIVKNKDLFNLPSDEILNTIKTVIKWSNNFIHTGNHEYSWCIYSVILAIHPLFESINTEDYISIDSQNFRSNSFNKKTIDERLREKFQNKDEELIIIFHQDV